MDRDIADEPERHLDPVPQPVTDQADAESPIVTADAERATVGTEEVETDPGRDDDDAEDSRAHTPEGALSPGQTATEGPSSMG